MNEFIGFAKELHATPDLFPWMCLAILLILAYKNRNFIGDYVKASIKAKHETAIYHAQHNELVRNNTAALDNNTAALELVNQDRKEMISYIEYHEELSKERHRQDNERNDQIQQIVVQTRDMVFKNQKELAILTSDKK